MHADLTPDLVLDPGAIGSTSPATGSTSGETASAGRGAGAGSRAKAPQQADPDEPSADDPDVDDDVLTGVELASREFGAKIVAEYDES